MKTNTCIKIRNNLGTTQETWWWHAWFETCSSKLMKLLDVVRQRAWVNGSEEKSRVMKEKYKQSKPSPGSEASYVLPDELVPKHLTKYNKRINITLFLWLAVSTIHICLWCRGIKLNIHRLNISSKRYGKFMSLKKLTFLFVLWSLSEITDKLWFYVLLK